MSNSALVDVTVLSPYFSRRTMPVSLITVHCTGGRGSASAIGIIFQAKGKDASSNYGIGTAGDIGLYVEEHCASWCSSDGWNDNRAVTVEVANCATPAEGHPEWPISPESWNSLVALCADVCRRNGKRRLVWLGDKMAALEYAGRYGAAVQGEDEMVLTAHRWYAAKSCPGDYIYDRLGALAAEVNRKIESMEDEDMTGEEIWRRLCGYLNGLPESEYAREASLKGIRSGLFLDGDNDGLVDSPRAPVTRQDLAVVLNRAGLLRSNQSMEAEDE